MSSPTGVPSQAGRSSRSIRRDGLRNAHDDLADHRVRLHVTFRFRQLLEWKYAIDQRRDAAVLDRGKDVTRERAGRFGALLRRELRVRYARDLEAVRVHRREIDVGVVLVVDIADDDE